VKSTARRRGFFIPPNPSPKGGDNIMRSISRLLSAFSTLADSLLALAGVVNIATDKLRQQFAVEAVEVIEHQPAGVEAPTGQGECPVEPSAAKRSRRSA
jgi:hypothetical protein